MNPAAKLGALLAAVAVVGAIGVAVGSTIRSPADVEADRRPPSASPVTARVERKALASNLVLRGTIRYQDPLTVSLAGPVGGGDGPAPTTQVVTRLAERGAELTEGAVALTVSGRPVFVVQGAQPMYRPITLGAVGTDVAQMEAALARAGLDAGPADGVADAAFMAAVSAWYQRSGYQPQGLTPSEQERKRSLDEALRSAEREALSARTALDAAAAPPAAADYLQADVAVANAGDALAAAQRAAAAADLAAAAAAAAADPAGAAAATTGSGGVDPAAAQDQVRQAERALAVARAQRAGLDAAKPLDTQRQAVDAAARTVEAARAELDRFNATTGTSVPAGEVVFVPTLPVRVDELKVKIGDALTGAALTLSGTRLAVDASAAAVDRELIRQGITVEVEATDTELRTTGTVDVIDAKAGTRGLDAGRVYLSVRLEDASLAGELAGSAVRIVVPIAGTAGEVLTVPAAAVITRADGTAVVELATGGGEPGAGGATRVVTVRPGLAAGGDVEITPIDGSLAPGDRVVVGKASGSSPSSVGGGPATTSVAAKP